MQVSSVSIPNGRIRSAIPLEESKIEPHARGLKKLAETRMSRVEMEREESVHDDLVFEYSSRYREFSGKARQNQASMAIQSSDEDDYKENEHVTIFQNRETKVDNQLNKKSNDFLNSSPYKKANKLSESSKTKPKIDQDRDRDRHTYVSENSEEELELNDSKPRSKKESNNFKGNIFRVF